MYHTLRLTDMGGNRTIIFDIETRETKPAIENVYSVLNEFNKKGYFLTAVDKNNYYLSKRLD